MDNLLKCRWNCWFSLLNMGCSQLQRSCVLQGVAECFRVRTVVQGATSAAACCGVLQTAVKC